jgi:hypothetical protein
VVSHQGNLRHVSAALVGRQGIVVCVFGECIIAGVESGLWLKKYIAMQRQL